MCAGDRGPLWIRYFELEKLPETDSNYHFDMFKQTYWVVEGRYKDTPKEVLLSKELTFQIKVEERLKKFIEDHPKSEANDYDLYLALKACLYVDAHLDEQGQFPSAEYQDAHVVPVPTNKDDKQVFIQEITYARERQFIKTEGSWVNWVMQC